MQDTVLGTDVNERSSTFKTTRVAHRCQTALQSGTSGVLFLGLHVLLATVASNATRGNHGLLFQGSMCHHNRLKLQCTDGSGPLTTTALKTATATLHSAAFGHLAGLLLFTLLFQRSSSHVSFLGKPSKQLSAYRQRATSGKAQQYTTIS